MKSKYSRGVALCLIATVSWGGMFPVMTSALRHIDPFTFTCMRYGIAGLIFLVLLAMTEGRTSLKVRGERMGLAFFFGAVGFAGFQFLVFLGQQKLGAEGALLASVMMATMPMLGFLVNWVVRRVVPPRAALGFIMLSFFGITLVVTKGDFVALFNQPQDFTADIMIILGALCWVVYTYGASYFPTWSPVRYTTVTTVLGVFSAVGITAVLLVTGVVAVPGPAAVVEVSPELAYMSLAAAVVGVLAWNLGNKILTPLNGVLFMDVVPMTSFIVSAALGVLPSLFQLIGAIITAGALVLNNLYLRRAATRTTLAAEPAAPVDEGRPLAVSAPR
ncbi:MAG: hypothetical protein QG671_1488 [Actinomycetota bacterium]|nr:hypothetical protein [Actinomycetota bacterium]